MFEHWPRNAARYPSLTALGIVGVQCAGGRPPPRLGAEGSGLQAREGSPRRGLVSHVGPGPGGPHRLRDTPEEQRHGETLSQALVVAAEKRFIPEQKCLKW